MQLSKLMKEPISNLDLIEMFGDGIRILTYEELMRYDNLDDVFGGKPLVFLLYEHSPNTGHWTSLFRNTRNDPTTFFDSYGNPPDDQFKFISNPKFNYPHHLTYLIRKSRKGLKYNHHKFQSTDKKNISTCGRWAALFSFCMQYMTIDDFIKAFGDGDDLDYIVSALTQFL